MGCHAGIFYFRWRATDTSHTSHRANAPRNARYMIKDGIDSAELEQLITKKNAEGAPGELAKQLKNAGARANAPRPDPRLRAGRVLHGARNKKRVAGGRSGRDAETVERRASSYNFSGALANSKKSWPSSPTRNRRKMSSKLELYLRRATTS